jgi:hypothetical protein
MEGVRGDGIDGRRLGGTGRKDVGWEEGGIVVWRMCQGEDGGRIKEKYMWEGQKVVEDIRKDKEG